MPRAVSPLVGGGVPGGSPQWVFPTSTPEYKKSFENDAQSSDNINFLKVQWSSRQLPTVRLQARPGLAGEGTERGVAEHIQGLPGRTGRACRAHACVCVSGCRDWA